MKMEPARGVVLLVSTSPGAADALDGAGFVVERAPETTAALARATPGYTGEDRRLDCVVAGHDLPSVDGLELSERLGRCRPELPVVLRPADGSEALAARALDAGASAYVPSRAPVERLVSAVERAVEPARASLSYR